MHRGVPFTDYGIGGSWIHPFTMVISNTRDDGSWYPPSHGMVYLMQQPFTIHGMVYAVQCIVPCTSSRIRMRSTRVLVGGTTMHASRYPHIYFHEIVISWRPVGILVSCSRVCHPPRDDGSWYPPSLCIASTTTPLCRRRVLCMHGIMEHHVYEVSPHH
jgi:hypothetical protein